MTPIKRAGQTTRLATSALRNDMTAGAKGTCRESTRSSTRVA